MGTFETRFREQAFFNRLQHRKETFAKMIEHLENNQWGGIIETGTLRIQDNFEGDGQSTFLWNWYADQIFSELGWKPGILSIDITPEHCDLARSVCPNVQVVCEDSIPYLTKLARFTQVSCCALFYMDAFDWSPENHLDSCFHHMAELATIYSHLPSGCMIVVDDKHGPLAGKHMMVQFFFEKLEINPVFDHYQVAWIKP